MTREREQELTEREIEEESAQELPDREALSLISGLGPNLSGNPLDMLSGATGGSGSQLPSAGAAPATPAPTAMPTTGTSLPAL